MKKVLFAFVIFVSFNTVNVFAQCGNIVLTNVSLQDTGYYQSFELLNFSLTNISSDTVTVDTLLVKGFVLNHSAIPDQVNTTNMVFLPGQSFPFSNVLNLVPTAFQTGDNVVVIWPIINQSNCDSAIEIIFVKDNVGINDPGLNSELYTSISGRNQLTIHNLTGSGIAQSLVHDLSGRIVKQYSENDAILNLSNLSAGLYILEVKLANKQKAIFKIAVQ